MFWDCRTLIQLSFSHSSAAYLPSQVDFWIPLVGCQDNMSQGKKHSWGERLRSFVGLGNGQRVEQSAAGSESVEPQTVQNNRRQTS